MPARSRILSGSLRPGRTGTGGRNSLEVQYTEAGKRLDKLG